MRSFSCFSAQRPAILTVFIVFLSQLGHDHFLPNSFQFTYPFIRRHIVWVTEKMSLNKLQNSCFSQKFSLFSELKSNWLTVPHLRYV
jgi:hypothetical protein